MNDKRPIARLIAHHEAGHAVACEALAVHVHEVSIVPTWLTSGHCQHASGNIDPIVDAMISAAGDAALEMLSPTAREQLRKRPRPPKTLVAEMERPLREVGLDPKDCGLPTDAETFDERRGSDDPIQIINLVYDILERHWAAVQMLADELLRFGTVDGDRVREIIKGATYRPVRHWYQRTGGMRRLAASASQRQPAGRQVPEAIAEAAVAVAL